MEINIAHKVRLFPQPTDTSCWSAAATMLYGDRSVGPGPAATEDGGLVNTHSNLHSFASAHGLKMHAPQSWTVEGITEFLRRGPVWVGGMVPSGHAYVIGAIQGDGTDEKTYITIYDPWPPRFGAVRIESYGNWMRSFPMATMYILQRF